MRVGWHDGIGNRRRVLCDASLKLLDQFFEARRGIHRPESGRRGDLVVSRTTGVELGGNVAGLLVQQAVDHRMNVFVRWNRTLTCHEATLHGVEAVLDRGALMESEHARAVQRHSPRLRGSDVIWPEAEIDANRIVQRFERRGGSVTESSAPQFVNDSGSRVGGDGGHAIASSRSSVEALSSVRGTSGSTELACAAASWSLRARTRFERLNNRIKPAASLC